MRWLGRSAWGRVHAPTPIGRRAARGGSIQSYCHQQTQPPLLHHTCLLFLNAFSFTQDIFRQVTGLNPILFCKCRRNTDFLSFDKKKRGSDTFHEVNTKHSSCLCFRSVSWLPTAWLRLCGLLIHLLDRWRPSRPGLRIVDHLGQPPPSPPSHFTYPRFTLLPPRSSP